MAKITEYTNEQIYNADETELFFKIPSNRIF